MCKKIKQRSFKGIIQHVSGMKEGKTAVFKGRYT